MKNRLLKIANDTSLILEIYKSSDLNKSTIEQRSKFCGLCNDTLKAQKVLAYDFLILKGDLKKASILKNKKSYISQIVEVTNNALIELKESLNLTFDNKYISQF